LQAGKFIGAIAKICGGGGGGRPNLAQAGGRDPSKLQEALETAGQQMVDLLST
jgi:alanyl-tRNA synthetase